MQIIKTRSPSNIHDLVLKIILFFFSVYFSPPSVFFFLYTICTVTSVETRQSQVCSHCLCGTGVQSVEESGSSREGYGRSMDRFPLALGGGGGGGCTPSNSPLLQTQAGSAHVHAYRVSRAVFNVEHSSCARVKWHERNPFFFFYKVSAFPGGSSAPCVFVCVSVFVCDDRS